MSEDERDDDDPDASDVPDLVQTICPMCGGGGMIADPKMAVIGGVARTVDNGRPCPLCSTEGHLPGLVPPV
ncbi:hypothetical protein [Actinokineospora inagensis]|uniref:hypothetical protein n=1 Tax=Actinokineospora inagensis TaxID=103730 RepID=UPI00042291A6|nr:hypothetical protein [Actinokineospora inagensis]